MPALQIRRARVREGRLDLEVETDLQHLRVDEPTAQRILALLPNLARHVCVNGKGERFGEELVGTELPHLLEHVIIELEGRAHAADAGANGPGPGSVFPAFPLFRGHTSWLAELSETRPQGIALMRVTVGFQDDLVALKAAGDAGELVNWACAPGDEEPRLNAPDVAAMVADLRSLM